MNELNAQRQCMHYELKFQNFLFDYLVNLQFQVKNWMFNLSFQNQLVTKRNLMFSAASLFLFAIFVVRLEAASLNKVSLITQDYFEKVYIVNQQGRKYYLIVSCKERDMLSISISQKRDFEEAPRFNIYGNNDTKPRMGQAVYSFLKECHAIVDVNSSNFLQVRRTKDSEAIFTISNVTFRNLHNTFVVDDTSTKWGLGQRFQEKFRVTNGKWTIWNRDKPWKIDRGVQGLSDQTYGHQPLYLARQKQTNLYHLAYFKNTHGLLVDVSQDGDQLLYNSVGGSIHFIILLGQSDPEEVLERYHDYIGRAHIPPFWSMGYHQCRWGYKTIGDLNKVLQQFRANDLPIDTIWSDLDYMQDKMIFTVNHNTHGKNALNEMMSKHDVHFIPLIDVGVATRDSIAMQKGRELDIFLHNPRQISQYYIGEVWPGQVHFVDYLHPRATTFWKDQLKRLYEQVKFSGIWLDMNEPSNFRGNEPTNEPFRIQQNEGINQMTINVDIPHYSSSKDQLYHREVHAYFGHLSTVATHQFLKQVGQRPFIISRSNSVGTGHFAGHWTGDNVADWQFLRLSISGNFLFQIFGIQMVGSDICGFHADTTEQLCSRWMQLGSFYPFSRNHNEDQPRSQQPYSFGKTLVDTSRLSLKTRYALLKQLYTIMVMKQGKGSFFRPIGFQFYQDQKAFEQENLQTQFMIGKGLMITPIVYQNKHERDVYFPSLTQSWYSFKIDTSSGKVQTSSITKFEGGQKANIDNPLPSAPPVFLRGGYSILSNKPNNRATKLDSSFHMFAALKNGESFTQILAIEDYNNEAHLSECIEKGCAIYLSLKKVSQNNFVLSWNYQGSKQINGNIRVESIFAVQNDKKWSYSTSILLKQVQGQVKFQAEVV